MLELSYQNTDPSVDFVDDISQAKAALLAAQISFVDADETAVSAQADVDAIQLVADEAGRTLGAAQGRSSAADSDVSAKQGVAEGGSRCFSQAGCSR